MKDIKTGAYMPGGIVKALTGFQFDNTSTESIVHLSVLKKN